MFAWALWKNHTFFASSLILLFLCLVLIFPRLKAGCGMKGSIMKFHLDEDWMKSGSNCSKVKATKEWVVDEYIFPLVDVCVFMLQVYGVEEISSVVFVWFMLKLRMSRIFDCCFWWSLVTVKLGEMHWW